MVEKRQASEHGRLHDGPLLWQPETNHAVNSNNFRNWWRKFCFISTVRVSIISFYFFLLSLSLYNALGAVRVWMDECRWVRPGFRPCLKISYASSASLTISFTGSRVWRPDAPTPLCWKVVIGPKPGPWTILVPKHLKCAICKISLNSAYAPSHNIDILRSSEPHINDNGIRQMSSQPQT